MSVVLDIETVPVPGPVTSLDSLYLPKVDTRLKDPDKIAAAELALEAKLVKARSIDSDFGKIVTIGVIDTVRDNKEHIFSSDDEPGMLKHFWALMKRINPSFGTITYNGLNFDLAWLQKRSMLHNILPCQRISLRRYSFIPHFDVMQALSNWGASKFKSLGFYAELFGVADSKNGDGSEVYGLYKEGLFDALGEYCINDCRVTLQVYNCIKDFYPIADPTRIDRTRSSY